MIAQPSPAKSVSHGFVSRYAARGEQSATDRGTTST
jgi:hypothetical protein